MFLYIYFFSRSTQKGVCLILLFYEQGAHYTTVKIEQV